MPVIITLESRILMPAKPTHTTKGVTSPHKMDYETLVKRVSERVMELWREDVRRGRERGAKVRRR
jgi:hypothetical protein